MNEGLGSLVGKPVRLCGMAVPLVDRKTMKKVPLEMEGDPVAGPENGVSGRAKRMLELDDPDRKTTV